MDTGLMQYFGTRRYLSPARKARQTAEEQQRFGKTTPPRVKRMGFRPTVVLEHTLLDALAQVGQGTTKLERAIDGMARAMGIRFDDYQYYIPLTNFDSTRVDFVIFNPPTAIYADGIQHELRPDGAQQDIARRQELETMGWRVVAIRETDFIIDPQNEIARILYG